MSGAKARGGHDVGGKKAGGDAPGADGFGNEIERMLLDRPMTRQNGGGAGPAVGGGGGGGPTNTLDELMAELGMLRGERGELALPADRQLGRNATRQPAPRLSTGDASYLLGGDGILRPGTSSGTPRTPSNPGALIGPLVLPPAKGALPSLPATSPGGPGSPGLAPQGSALGPVRAQSPMSTRRSITGASPSHPGPGTLQPPAQGVLERQAQLEMRLEKMETREQQLMALINQLQQQVSTLSRAQQATQQQLAFVSSSPATAATITNTTTATAASAAVPPVAAGAAAAAAASGPQAHVSDEDFIKDDEGPSREASPKQQAQRPTPQAAGKAAGKAAAGPAAAPAPPPAAAAPGPQRVSTPPVVAAAAAAGAPTPTPPATGAPPLGPNGRPNKLTPQPGPPAEWEADVVQLRKEVGALAANVVRVREQLGTLVPGGPSLMAEELAAQAAAAAQLKQNLTQIAMDVVSLHKGLTTLKHNTDRNFTTLEKNIGDIQLQAQTNAFNQLTSSPAGAMPAHAGNPNAVAAALAAAGGVNGSLEESLRSAFAKPAMRQLPQFNPADLGFMPDNSGAAAAMAAYGGMGGGGGGGGGRKEAPPGGGGGLNAAWALLSSFEEQAATEKEEQQKAAAIGRQAVSIVDAKVKQVVLQVDRHMQLISADVEERLRMYEQTIIRMAQQVDRVQRVLRELEGAAGSRIVVRRGGQEVDPEAEADEAARRAAAEEEAARRAAEEEARQAAAKENWVKAAAMATGRFMPQQKEEKKQAAKPAHGYFQTFK